ncbi:hypothetical protein BC829DRAFT_389013 [Chytridium lagenaria]|nr:hypothetical protein BC829DRAFT_389013 [Chytridium lagenaria]
MVDVGTGYFIQKSVPDAKEYFKGKVTYLKTNLEKLHLLLTDVMQAKMEQAQASQQASAAAKA